MEPEISFVNQSSADANAFSWEFGSSGAYGNSNEETPVIIFPDTEPGSYPVELVVTNDDGCQDSISWIVQIDGVFTCYAPSAFTPNGDGNNDFFFLQGESIDDEEFELSIFDRWGGIVFSSNTYTAAWDGLLKGGTNPAKSDVYIWRVETRNAITGERVELKGHVTLLR